MFAAGRAFEQVRNSVGYPHLNVKIGGDARRHFRRRGRRFPPVLRGFRADALHSRHGRCSVPADDVEARAAVKAAYAYDGPVYLRFGRLAMPVFHDAGKLSPLRSARARQLTDGNDVAIIATGLMVNEALMAAKTLAEEGIHARVINICTIKPLDEEIVIEGGQGLRQGHHLRGAQHHRRSGRGRRGGAQRRSARRRCAASA